MNCASIVQFLKIDLQVIRMFRLSSRTKTFRKYTCFNRFQQDQNVLVSGHSVPALVVTVLLGAGPGMLRRPSRIERRIVAIREVRRAIRSRFLNWLRHVGTHVMATACIHTHGHMRLCERACMRAGPKNAIHPRPSTKPEWSDKRTGSFDDVLYQ